VTTAVYITIDTECTEERLVRGQIRPPVGYEMMMWGRFANQRRGYGVGLLIDELGRRDLAATFFVEALCAEVFGHQGLADVCGALMAANQDIQLHLHPNLRRPAWRHAGGQPLPDNIGDYSLPEQLQLLRDGIDHLVRCGVSRERITGYRAGNFGAGNATWTALRDAGLWVDSSLNLSYLDKDCRIRVDGIRNDLFEAEPGVWELPVTNFREGRGFRPLQITAITVPEMTTALWRAHRLGIEHVTIVTHPAEFFVIDSAEQQRGRPNRINLSRLRGLVDFLAAHRDAFTVSTVGALGVRAQQQQLVAPANPTAVPPGRSSLRWGRLAMQALKRVDLRVGRGWR
jgi:hypothetical protein